MDPTARVVPTIGPGALLRPRLRGLLNRWVGADRAERALIAFFLGVGGLFWVGLFAALWVGMDAFWGIEIFGPIISRKLLELLLVSLFGLLLFSNIIAALSAFFLSEDLELLLSLPVRRDVFFYTRLFDTLGQSSWMMAFFGLPMFLAYGHVSGAVWWYYALLVVVVPCYLAIPAAVGSTVAAVLVTFFPARRMREGMVLLGLLAMVALFILLRVLEPERLVNPENFESAAAYLAQLQVPAPSLFPATWALEVLQAGMRGQGVPWLPLGLLVSGAAAAMGVSRWITSRLWADGWTRSQVARAPRFAGSRTLDAVLAVATRPLPPQVATLVIKDVRVFLRDPAQWSQLFLVVGLIVIYLVSARALGDAMFGGAAVAQGLRNGLAFFNLGVAGFIMASIAGRFQFAVVSGEGRAFWLVRSAPLDPERFLWAKGVPGMLPMVVVGLTLSVAVAWMFRSPPALIAVSGCTALALAFGISGIAMGMGATFPDFKADNMARVAAGPQAMLFMVSASALVALVLLIQVFPVYTIVRAAYVGQALTAGELGLITAAQAVVAGVCAVATVLPVRRAAKGLWERTW